MGFDVTDLADESQVLFVNFWNWRPTVEIIRVANLLNAERLEGLHQQMSATRVSRDEARSIARYLRERVLPNLTPESRVMLDGTIITEPDDGTFYRNPEDLDRNYSATRPWLESFADFCASCGGFEFN